MSSINSLPCYPLADPDRPKNDKATILGDSVQTVRELRAEVKRLKSEHDALSEESRDVSCTRLHFSSTKLIFLFLSGGQCTACFL